jgi:hypothetical protein
MRATAIGAGLLTLILVSGCGATPGQTTTAGQSPSPEPSSCPTSGPDGESSAPSICPPAGGQSGGPGGQPAGPGAPGGPGGPGGDFVTRTWSETVRVSDTTMQSVVHQEYQATIHVVFGSGDGTGGWTLTGTAEITSAFTSDGTEQLQDITGAPCSIHYTDNAGATGTVNVIDGGIEARDGFYQFHVDIPGVDGSNTAVRDDSGCLGANTTEQTPWSAAPIIASGNGEYTGRHISGSFTEPRQEGEDKVTWSLTLPQ